jgi:hypothetical protein
MPASPHEYFAVFGATLFEEIASLNQQIYKEKNTATHERQSAGLPTFSHLEFRAKVIEVFVGNV